MDKIIDFKNYLLAEYPETWLGIDGYIKYLIPHKYIPLTTPYESKYYKEFVPKITDSKIIYIPIDKANDKEKSYSGLFSSYFIDYEDLFKDFDKYYFDIESWSDKRKQIILKKTNEFLFECNVFKGITFFKEFGQTLIEIKGTLTNLEKVDVIYCDKPNWLQEKIRKVLIIEVETIQNIIISNYELIYPKLSSVFNESVTALNKSNTFTWYKIAKTMATGFLEIEKLHYIINGKKIHNESEAARQMSKHIYGNESKSKSIKPFLNQTKQNVPDENKNIFLYHRIKDLKIIANEAAKQKNLSDYFKKQISKLEAENNNQSF